MSGIAENGMSIQGGDGSGSRRLFAAGLAAVVLHVALISIPLLRSASAQPSDSAPVVVDFEAEAIQTQSAPETQASLAVQPSPAPSPAPLSAPTAQADTDFTIPTPKSTAQQPNPAPAGNSFRESGSRTGALTSAPTTEAPTGPSPNLPANLSSQTQSASAGAASSLPPTKGEGVLVSGQTKQSPGGSLDLGALDKALAGAKSGTQTTGQTGLKQPAAQGGKIGEPQIQWEKPEAAKNRKLLLRPDPKIPSWVGSQGLTLKVTVSFAVSPEGVVSIPTIVKSSGYGDVDAAILDALRQWRFTADSASGSIRGVAPIVIQPQ